jgi:hypothetical protein
MMLQPPEEGLGAVGRAPRRVRVKELAALSKRVGELTDDLYRVVSEYLGLKRRLEDILERYEASSAEDVEAKIRRGELPRERSYEGYRRVYEDRAEAIAIQHEMATLEERMEKMVKRGTASG